MEHEKRKSSTALSKDALLRIIDEARYNIETNTDKIRPPTPNTTAAHSPKVGRQPSTKRSSLGSGSQPTDSAKGDAHTAQTKLAK